MTLKMSVVSLAYRDACDSLLKNFMFYNALWDEVSECRMLPLSSDVWIATGTELKANPGRIDDPLLADALSICTEHQD